MQDSMKHDKSRGERWKRGHLGAWYRRNSAPDLRLDNKLWTVRCSKTCIEQYLACVEKRKESTGHAVCCRL